MGQTAQLEIATSLPAGKDCALRKFCRQKSPFFRRQLRNFERMRVVAANTTKAVSDVSPAIAETYQMIRKTGKRRLIDNDTHEY